MASPDSEGAGGSQGTGGSSMPHPVSSCTEKTGCVPASITIFLYIYFGSHAALITMTTACPNYQTYAEAVWLSWQRCSQSGDQRKESPGWTAWTPCTAQPIYNEEWEWKQLCFSHWFYPTATLAPCSKKQAMSYSHSKALPTLLCSLSSAYHHDQDDSWNLPLAECFGKYRSRLGPRSLDSNWKWGSTLY